MLLSQDPENTITVAAKHMPGDYDIEYTSPWAGANYLPYVPPSPLQYEKPSFNIGYSIHVGLDRRIARLDNGKKRHGRTSKN